MGGMRRMQSATAGTNRRGQYASGRYDDRPRTEEQLEAAMDVLIQKAHCRLLERATQGRWTWLGDDIVPGPGSRKRRGAVETAAPKQVTQAAYEVVCETVCETNYR